MELTQTFSNKELRNTVENFFKDTYYTEYSIPNLYLLTGIRVGKPLEVALTYGRYTHRSLLKAYPITDSQSIFAFSKIGKKVKVTRITTNKVAFAPVSYWNKSLEDRNDPYLSDSGHRVFMLQNRTEFDMVRKNAEETLIIVVNTADLTDRRASRTNYSMFYKLMELDNYNLDKIENQIDDKIKELSTGVLHNRTRVSELITTGVLTELERNIITLKNMYAQTIINADTLSKSSTVLKNTYDVNYLIQNYQNIVERAVRTVKTLSKPISIADRDVIWYYEDTNALNNDIESIQRDVEKLYRKLEE
jgi:hypothetical protein